MEDMKDPFMKIIFSSYTRIILYTLFVTTSLCALDVRQGDLHYQFSGIFKPEMLYGRNINLLNNNNDIDKIWYMRHTLDLNIKVDYELCSKPVGEFLFTLRDRAIWGNANSIASTSRSEVSLLNTAFGSHSHGIPRHIFWMREGWIRLHLNTILSLPIRNDHWLSLGAFPFRLGRGISLGDAYAVGPELLGFYTDSIVDQFAFGGKISGFIFKDILSYDLYAAILQNRCSSISETGEKIYGQQYGRITSPARGFGKINFLIAARTLWYVVNDDCYGKLIIEPYALYNSDPEQRIEFFGDASSKLGTIGMAAEYSNKKFECGFDCAFNLGRQLVKGWDRNQVIFENRNGQVIMSNSHVVDQNNQKIVYVANSEAQNKINFTAQAQSQNGQIIGTVNGNVGFVPGPVTLKNAANRFRDSYTNKYQGWMFIADASYWICPKNLQVAAMAGIASGDDNPNLETIDGTFDGFIGLQEIYSGKRVNSAFFLGGAGRPPRPLSIPRTNQVASRFAPTVSRFTNLVLMGSSLYWEPVRLENIFNVKTNIIAYWQEKPTNQFDVVTRKERNALASNFLGIETNLFLSYMMLKNTRLFFVGSIFFPGQHYTDIKGIPLNSDQDRLLDLLDVTGFSEDRIPNLGDNASYTMNIGLEYLF